MEGTRGSHHCWGFFKHKLYSNNPDRHYSPRYIPSTETIHTPTHYIIPVLYMARPPLCCHYGITHKYKIGQSTKRLVTSDICRICFDWPCSSVFLCVPVCSPGDVPSVPQTGSRGDLPPRQTWVSRHRTHVWRPHRHAQDWLQYVHEGERLNQPHTHAEDTHTRERVI